MRRSATGGSGVTVLTAALACLVVASTPLSAAAPLAPAAMSGRDVVRAAPWPLTAVQTAFYDMGLLPDGYPGRYVDGRLRAHPLYGVYLVRGFTTQPRRTGDPRSRAALRVVAHAAVDRMRPAGSGLAFWYDARSVTLPGMSSHGYSALTQAYYAEALAEAGRLLRDPELVAAADACFRSLLVPVSRGGVLSPRDVGPVLEEEPVPVPSAILNGWLSATVAVRGYARITGSARAAALASASAAEIARRLARYDLPWVLGSAYSARTTVALRFAVPVGTRVDAVGLEIDGRLVPLRPGGPSGRSDTVRVLQCGRTVRGVVVTTCRKLVLDVPATIAGRSTTTRLLLTLRDPQGRAVAGTVERAAYRFVHMQGRSISGWRARTALDSVTRAGTVRLTFTSAEVRRALVPTGFKLIDRRLVNTYHNIHVGRLNEMSAAYLSLRPTLSEWAQRWSAYTCG